jgi:hypothetical protein
MEYYLEKIFHIPIKKVLKWLVKKIKESIDQFIDDGYRSIWSRIQKNRALKPNGYTSLQNKRESSAVKRKKRRELTLREMILQERKTRRR